MNKPTYLIAIPGTGFPWYIFLNSLELNHNSGLAKTGDLGSGLDLDLDWVRTGDLDWGTLTRLLWLLHAIGKCNRCYIFFSRRAQLLPWAIFYTWPTRPGQQPGVTKKKVWRKIAEKKSKNTPDVFHKQHFDYDDAGAQTQIDVFIWKLNQSQVSSSEFQNMEHGSHWPTCVLRSGLQLRLSTEKKSNGYHIDKRDQLRPWRFQILYQFLHIILLTVRVLIVILEYFCLCNQRSVWSLELGASPIGLDVSREWRPWRQRFLAGFCRPVAKAS